jgi:hypothetical protein
VGEEGRGAERECEGRREGGSVYELLLLASAFRSSASLRGLRRRTEEHRGEGEAAAARQWGAGRLVGAVGAAFRRPAAAAAVAWSRGAAASRRGAGAAAGVPAVPPAVFPVAPPVAPPAVFPAAAQGAPPVEVGASACLAAAWAAAGERRRAWAGVAARGLPPAAPCLLCE